MHLAAIFNCAIDFLIRNLMRDLLWFLVLKIIGLLVVVAIK